jgi:hypothetical protein
MPTGYIPQPDSISPNQRFVLGEEEMADVSLATFHLFDKESRGRRSETGLRCRSPGLRWLPRMPWLPWLGVGWRGCGAAGLRRLLRTLGTLPLVLG